jgi:hypothetical protein
MKNLIPMLVLLSASVQASEIDNLITASSEIRATFDMVLKQSQGKQLMPKKVALVLTVWRWMLTYLSQKQRLIT